MGCFRVFAALSLLVFVSISSLGAVHMQEKVSYGGWPNCVRLTNGTIELIVTTDVGPRVIRFGFVGGQNVFKEYSDQMGKRGGNEWRIYGGHRLWHAPEAMPRTYFPDNEPVKYSWDGKTLKLEQPIETTTGILKEWEIGLDPSENHVKVLHRLTNRNLWDVELAPWALTVMAPGGKAVLPQEPYRSHEDYLLAARPMALWGYTDMHDPRWSWGTRYIQFRQDSKAATSQKVGILNTQGWSAYSLNGDLFVKRFGYDPNATYPDFGCNNEAYTDAQMLEVESLGPVLKLLPGGKVDHVEHWFIWKAQLGDDESSMDKGLMPLIRQTDRFRP